MAGLFISYRRADYPELVRDLYDRIIRHFPRARVFRDVDNLRGGVPFPDQLYEALANSNIVLALIGPSWSQRLNDPQDFVRQEVEQALASQARVVPVLLAASMPSAESIPQSLLPLLQLHALSLRPEAFEKDLERLLSQIDGEMKQRPTIPIFNGKDMTNWYLVGPHMTNVSIRDSVLTANNTTRQLNYVDHLVTSRTDFEDFYLQYEFFLESAEVPSGVLIRVDPSQVTFGGMRGYLIVAGGSDYTVQKKELEPCDFVWDQRISSLSLTSRARPGFGLVQQNSNRALTAGTWHRVEVKAIGNRLRVWINRHLGGITVRERPLIELNESGRAFQRGAIALQFFPGSSIRYRNIRIRRLRNEKSNDVDRERVRWTHRQMIGNEWNERWQLFQNVQKREWVESVTDDTGFWQYLYSEVSRTDDYVELQREYGPNKRVVVRLFNDYAAIGEARDQLSERRNGEWESP